MLVYWPMKGSNDPSAPPAGDDAHLEILSRPWCEIPHGPSSIQDQTAGSIRQDSVVAESPCPKNQNGRSLALLGTGQLPVLQGDGATLAGLILP